MVSRSSVLNKATNRFRKLVQKDIREKNLIKTGDLIRSIDVEFKDEKDKVVFTIGAIFYYTFLDDGTTHIRSRNITKDVTESAEFAAILKDTIGDYVQVLIDETFTELGSKGIDIT